MYFHRNSLVARSCGFSQGRRSRRTVGREKTAGTPPEVVRPWYFVTYYIKTYLIFLLFFQYLSNDFPSFQLCCDYVHVTSIHGERACFDCFDFKTELIKSKTVWFDSFDFNTFSFFFSNLFPSDLNEHVIFIGDWLHQSTMDKFVMHHHSDKNNKGEGMLINGRGMFTVSFFTDFFLILST